MPEQVDDQTVVIEDLLNQARVCKTAGQWSRARIFVERAVSRQAEFYGTESRQIAISLYMLSDILWHQGQYQAASSIFRRASLIWQKHYPLDVVSSESA